MKERKRRSNNPNQTRILPTTLPQVTIRQLGPPLVAMFLPTRLLGAVAASYVLLGARLESAAEWAGLLTVAATTTWYLVTQHRAAA